MEMKVTQAFNREALEILKLNTEKKASLFDFIPLQVINKSSNERKHPLWLLCCLIDNKSRFPVLLKIIGTRHSQLPKDLNQKVID